jgi:hypothetical protein
MPRNKASISLFVKALEKVLTEHPADDALKNRIRVTELERWTAENVRRALGEGV